MANDDELDVDDDDFGEAEAFEFEPLADFPEEEAQEAGTRGGGGSRSAEKPMTLDPEFQSYLDRALDPGGSATRGRIGGEDRRRIKDPRKYPFSAICCLESRSGNSSNFSIGTGFLVGTNLLLTAGHNLINNNIVGRPTEVRIYPGRKGRNGIWSGVTEIADRSQFYTPKEWRVDKNRFLDWGFIRLKRPLCEKAGALGLKVMTPDLAKLDFMVAGYPSSKTADSPNRSNAFTLWYDIGRLAAIKRRTIEYKMDTSAGQSGAPLIVWDKSAGEGSKMVCVGVHNYDQQGVNRATKVTDALREALINAISRKS